MSSSFDQFLKGVVNAKVDLRSERRRLRIKTAVPAVLAAVFLAVLISSLSWLSYSRSPDRQYEAEVRQAEKIADPWLRFTELSKHVDPNTWARVWPGETEACQAWANATYLALQESVKRRDARAIAYLTTGQYAQYASLQELRNELKTEPK